MGGDSASLADRIADRVMLAECHGATVDLGCGPGRLTAALVSAGCGYSLRGNLPDHLQTVAVPVFQNRTPVPAVENFLTNAVVNAFATNGRLRVTSVDRHRR